MPIYNSQILQFPLIYFDVYVFQAPKKPISVTSRAKIVSWTVTFTAKEFEMSENFDFKSNKSDAETVSGKSGSEIAE